VPLRAGSDVWLFNGLLAYLYRGGHMDEAFVAAHTEGAQRALAVALETASDVGAVAHRCGVSTELLTELYELFARTSRTVTAFSMGVNQSSAGTDKVSSIVNCHLLTGRIGQPGMGPFSITGQPNAMGGREVGGMANMLAAHMELSDARHRQIVQDFWRSPRIADRPGLKAVELFQAIESRHVKAVWIVATNPVVSLPDADQVRRALARCELIVVSDVVQKTDTTAFAHVLLPAAAWGEKEGTVTNSERRISRQRAFLDPPGETRPDWWAMCGVAKRMGFAGAFEFASSHEIFSEHARLSAAGNEGTRAFDIGGLAHLRSPEFDALEPVQWPVPVERLGTARLFASGRFFHPDGRARFTPTAPRAPAFALNEEFPLVLNTGRIRDQWHTMTRTGISPRLSEYMPEPFADLHAQDALLLGVREGELVRVATQWGSLVARLRTSGDIARGALFVPIHWSATNASDGRVGALVNPVVDPESGEPEFKHTPARVEPFSVDWYGFILSRRPLAELDAAWWTAVRGQGFMRYEFACRRGGMDLAAWARRAIGTPDQANVLDYHDAAAGVYRAACLSEESLEACIHTSSRPQLPERAWIGALFEKPKLDVRDRIALLSGQPPTAAADPGPLVCSCHGVRRNAIVAAIRKHSLDSADGVGRHTKAGTNCGSCTSEVLNILNLREGLARASGG
jgi:assimilatory nitrate reductase catalytic subunit